MFIKRILIVTVAAVSLHAVPSIASENFKDKVAEQMDKIKEVSKDIKDYSTEKGKNVKKDIIIGKYATLASYHYALFKMLKNDNNPLKDDEKSKEHLGQAIKFAAKGVVVAKDLIAKEEDKKIKDSLKEKFDDLKDKLKSYRHDQGDDHDDKNDDHGSAGHKDHGSHHDHDDDNTQ